MTDSTGDPPFAADVDKPRNVIDALRCVMRDLPGIGRDSKAAQEMGGYAFRGIEDITQHTQALFAKHGVVFVPRVLDETWQRDVVQVGGKPWHDDRMLVEYDVYGPGGVDDKITVGPIPAIGRDGADKGANKCMTQAYKYALLQTLNIADKADDADSGSPEMDRARAERHATTDQAAALRELIKQASDAQLSDELLATDNDGVKFVMGVPVWSPFTDEGGTARLRLLPTMDAMEGLIDSLRDRVQAAMDPTGLVGDSGTEPDPDAKPADPGPEPAPTRPSEPMESTDRVLPAGEGDSSTLGATGPAGTDGEATGPAPPTEAEARAALERADAVVARHKKFTDEVAKLPTQTVRERLYGLDLDSLGPAGKVRARLVDHYMDMSAKGDAYAQAGAE